LAYANGDNSGDSRGGGISNEGGGTAVVRNSTIAQNHSLGLKSYVLGYGGGISTDADSVLDVHNTIVAGNDAKTGGDDLYGYLANSGYNLIGKSSGGTGYSQTDLLDVDPLLGPLQDNGGLTQTMALLPGSPAIDSGDNTDAPPYDQRGQGFPRIVNGTID